MKEFKLCLLAFCVFYSINTFSQTIEAEGYCDYIEVDELTVPSYPSDLYIHQSFGCIFWGEPDDDPCKRFISDQYPLTCKPATARYKLQVWDGQGWDDHRPWQLSSTFTNINTHGWYRVVVQIPELREVPSCEGGYIEIVDDHLQYLGKAGKWSSNYYTGYIAVGATVQTDLTYDFVDASGSGSTAYYGPSETVKINTSGTKNYEQYYLAIFENDGSGPSYYSQGWADAPMDTEINISYYWYNGTGTGFEQIPTSYTVQLAISNNDCPSQPNWTVLEKDFAICSSGQGCKIANNDINIQFYPNPARETIRLRNIKSYITNGKYKLEIRDISGRLIENRPIDRNSFDISSLNSGLYILSILDPSNNLVHTSKVSKL